MAEIVDSIDPAALNLVPAHPEPLTFATLDSATVAGLPVVDFSEAVVCDTITEEPEPWLSGLEPVLRHSAEANRSGLLAVIALFGVLMAFNFRHLRRICSQFFDTLARPRAGRTNLFDEHPAGDTRLTILLLLQFAVCAGILVCQCVVSATDIGSASNLSIAAVVGLSMGYVAAQVAVYSVVGYTFGGREVMRRWVGAFTAVHALMGTFAIIPMALAIFYPEAVHTVCLASAAVYLLARLTFIFRGFKIFYDNFLSCFYFILYLCTLEIIPLVFVYQAAYAVIAKAL